jgi:CHAT domain-containing protein
MAIGDSLVNEGRSKEALTYLEEGFKSLKKSHKGSNRNLAKTTISLGSANEKAKNYKKSISCYLMALNNIELDRKKGDSTYLSVLNRLGLNYRRVGDYDNSIDFFKKGLKIEKVKSGDKSEKYAKTLNSISISYKRKDDFVNALKYNKLSTEIIKNLYGVTSSEYSKKISSLNQIYWKLSKYDKAIPLQKYILSLYSEVEKDSLNYAQAIFTMSLLYNGTNEYRKEIELLKEFKQIVTKTPKYNKYIIYGNQNLAVAYDNLGDYEKAITIIKDVIENTSKDDENYPTRLQNLAFYHTSLGEFDKALSIYNEALKSCKSIFGIKHTKYAQLIDAIGQLHLRRGEFNKSKTLFKEAITVLEEIEDFDESHSEYGFYLNNYASVLLELKQYDEAIKLLNKNIEISESDSINDKERYYKKKHNLAKAYTETGKYNEALDILNNFKEAYGLRIGSTHPDYGQLLKNLGKAYLGNSDYENSIPHIDSSNNVLISQIDKVFKFRSEKENKEFIKTLVPEFDEFQSMLVNNKESMRQLIEMNLNNQLLLKNLLLSQSRKIMDKLVESKDSSTVNNVYRYKELKAKINKSYSSKSLESTENFDSLRNVLNEKEVELAKLYSDKFSKDVSLIKDWKIAKEELEDNEIAIEFSNFKYFKNNNWKDSTLYVAYVYKREWDNPKIVNLFKEKELIKLLNNKSPNQLYITRGSKAKGISNLENIYDLVLKPLETELMGVKTIYFSPSGILNQIPFSAISINKTERLLDKYSLIRLSTTNKISELESLFHPNDIVFFGGVDYDFSHKDSSKESTLLSLKELEAFKSSNSNLRSSTSWKFLPGTLAEIKNISSQFENKNKTSKVLRGRNATEEEFKKLDGNSPKIIHIATHGFFYENIKSKSVNNADLNIYSYAEDPLLRSGLILAGGNYAWENGINPYGKEDGILTAMEISNLDLSNTDLVVLSACETGLGDIDGSEGVYGLQRAFKMAGVDIIVMSLWEVADKETSEFMEHFYLNWLNGMNLRDAFSETQRAMANKYNDMPEKWAAFVLFE